jgi:galactose mutarotase-like enzyme
MGALIQSCQLIVQPKSKSPGEYPDLAMHTDRREFLLTGLELSSLALWQPGVGSQDLANWKSVRRGQYKGQTSYVLETKTLAAEFIHQGGRMVSLRHKASNREFLVQQQSGEYLKAEYAKVMIPAQAAGYDDMFPTILECFYPDFPWKGVLMPDHGEVWALDWDVEQEKQALAFSVSGVRLPYRLVRRARFTAENRLRLEYALENLAPFELLYLWSAHPMFQVEAGCQFILPPECRRAKTSTSLSGRIGRYGDEFEWPIWTDSKAVRHNLSLLRGPEAQDLEKYFFSDRLVHGWCRLAFPSSRLILSISFSPKEIPYLAIVVGENIPGDPRTYALLEPCTAPFDRLDLSTSYTTESRLMPKAKRTWSIEFSVDLA